MATVNVPTDTQYVFDPESCKKDRSRNCCNDNK